MKKIFITLSFAFALAPALASAQLTSGPWVPDSGAPAAPQNLHASCNTAGDQVTLSWSPATNASSYSIRVNIPGHTDFVYTGELFDTSITLRLPMNQEYAWWVHSNNAANPLGPYTFGPRFTCQPSPSQTPTFSASPTSGVAPLTVTFKFSGTGNTYRVDFGDGASQDLHPECYTGGGCEFPHTYASIGTYAASLRTLAGVSVASVSISVTPPLTSGASCTLDGVTVAHGATRKFYLHREETSASMCQTNAIDRTCNSGVLSGASSYQYAACTWPVTGNTPSITITAPQNGASVAQGGWFAVSWQSQNPPTGSRVAFFLISSNGQTAQGWSIFEPSGSQTLGINNTVTPGPYTFEARLFTPNGPVHATNAIPITITAPGNPPPFAIGDRVGVRATNALNVRATPSTSGTILGAQPSGTLGTITDGPQSANGFTWWKINWDNSPIDGWSVQNFIVKIPNNTPSITITAPPPNQNYSIGSVIPISWTSQNAPAGTSVRLTLASPSSLPWVPGLPVNGSYNFTVPTILPGTYYIIVDLMTPAGAVLAHASVPYTVGGPANQNTLTANPSSGPAPLTTAFAFTVTNTLLAFRINFGDGTPLHEITAAEKSCTGTGPCSGSIAHTYASPGTYTAKLFANGGAETATAVVTATALGTQPSITITAPPSGSSVQVNHPVTISWQSQNAPANAQVILSWGPYGTPMLGIGGVQPVSGSYVWTPTTAYPSNYGIYATLRMPNYQVLAQTNIPFTIINPPPPFAIGDRVRATDALNVRATPSTSGTILGAQPTGAEGTITDGPQNANGYTWWKINWDNSPIDGWSVQNYIVKLPQPPVPPHGIGACVYLGQEYQEGTVSTSSLPANLFLECDNGTWIVSPQTTDPSYSTYYTYADFCELYAYANTGISTWQQKYGCTKPKNNSWYPYLAAHSRHGISPLSVIVKAAAGFSAGQCAGFTIDWGDGAHESVPQRVCTYPSSNYSIERIHDYSAVGDYTISLVSAYGYHHSANIRVDGPVAATKNEAQLANSLTALESALQSILKLLGR